MAETCFHCSEVIPKGVTLSVRYQGESRAVCCHGCQSVAELILDGGLNDYYRLRAEPAQRPEAIDSSWQAYDQEAFISTFVGQGEGSRRVELLVQNITCSACAWLIERRLARLSGLSNIYVNAAANKLSFDWDASEIPLSQVMADLANIGYPAQGWSSTTAASQAADELRTLLFRVGLAGIAFLQVMMFAAAIYTGTGEMDPRYIDLMQWFSLFISIPVVIYSAQPFYKGAFSALRVGGLSMDVPIATAISLAWGASIVATVSGVGEVYFDSVVMFSFFLLTGRYLEKRAQHRENDTLYSLSSWLPDTAIRLSGDGQEWLPSSALQYGDEVLIRAGDAAPADGVITQGCSSFDESLFSGEHLPVTKSQGSTIYAGTVNIEQEVRFRVEAADTSTQASAINQLLASAAAQKPAITYLVDRISGVFIGAVLAISLATYLFWTYQSNEHAFWIALSVLVVTCPCALSLATPVAITSAISGLRHRGVLVTNSEAMTQLSGIDTLILDKTGTLTKGQLSLVEVIVHDRNLSEDFILNIAGALEFHSNHPIATAFPVREISIEGAEVVVGRGVQGDYDGLSYAIGSARFVGANSDSDGNIFLAREGDVIAEFVIADTLREGSDTMVDALKRKGVNVILCSGDSRSSVTKVAKEVGIASYYFEQTPEQKYDLLRQLRSDGARIAMVGDGLNDVPVLGSADVSLAIASGASLARCHADMVLSEEQFTRIPNLFSFTQLLNRTIKQNLGWALGYNLMALPIAVAGFVPPWAAAIGMSLSSLVVVLNALKLNK